MQVLHKYLIISNINEPETNQPIYVTQSWKSSIVTNSYSKTYTIYKFW
jgi:hypothetical protein